eukprot:CFRG8407T1
MNIHLHVYAHGNTPVSSSKIARSPLLTPIARGIRTTNVPHAALVKSQSLNFAARFVNAAPGKVQPYLRLARMDKPIGTWLLFWPGAWSIALASPIATDPHIGLLATFGFGAFVMRGAGCTINDMWDYRIDRKVERTCDRPLASGAVSMKQAWVFLAGQLSVGLGVLLTLNPYSIALGACSMGLVVTYPLAKRFTWYPQAILGFTFNWGALLGYSAVAGHSDFSITLPLYASGVAWTLVYDTIYAHQDKTDDKLVGVKSTALRFGDNTRTYLAGFSSLTIAGLSLAGHNAGMLWPYDLALAATAGHLTWQVATANFDSPKDCMSKFVSNKWIGCMIFAGICGSKLVA